MEEAARAFAKHDARRQRANDDNNDPRRIYTGRTDAGCDETMTFEVEL
jgi:hypothetical protein